MSQPAMPKLQLCENIVFYRVPRGFHNTKLPKKYKVGKIVRKKFNILVIRVNSQKQLTLSRPCTNCILKLRSFGIINNVFYSNKNGDIVSEKLSEMSLLHQSRGTLNFSI